MECIKLLPLCCASRAAEVGTISATLLLASAPSWYVLHLDSYQTNAQYVFFIYKDMGLHMTHNIEVWTCNSGLKLTGPICPVASKLSPCWDSNPGLEIGTFFSDAVGHQLDCFKHMQDDKNILSKLACYF